MANRKNLATTQLGAGIAPTDTSVFVKDGSVLPSLPFYATLMPSKSIPNANNSEIVNVSASSATSAEYRILGETSQDTYAGKNLSNGVSTDYYINSAGTTYGRASGNTGLIIAVDTNTDYTISTTTTQARYRVGVCDSEIASGDAASKTLYAGANRDGTNSSITINTGSHSYLVVNASDLASIQVEIGSAATAFEPYVGGIPSPNPDYPQPVKMVGGEQVVSVGGGSYSLPLGDIELYKVGDYQDYIYKGEGLNLLDMTTTPLQIWQSTVNEQKNGSITITGTGTSGVRYATIELPTTLLGKTLTLSWGKSGYTSVVRAYIYNNGNPATEIQNLGDAGSGTFTMPTSLSSTQKVGLIFYVNTGTATFSNVMLVEGNTAMEFEPYGAKDKWCVRNNVGRLEVDGSSGGYNSTYKWWYVVTSSPRDTAVSSMFLSSTRNAMENNLTMSACATATDAVIIRNAALAQADYASWLASNKPVVFYPMTSPGGYMITDTTLTNALDALAGSLAEAPSGITAAAGYLPAEVDIITPAMAELTVARAQKGTTAKAFDADDILANGIYDDELVYNDGGVLKDANGSSIKLPLENIDITDIGLMNVSSNTAASGSGASSALGFSKDYANARGDEVMEIVNGRVKAKVAGYALVSGSAYVKGTGAQQVWIGVAKYNSAGTSFTTMNQQWTLTNATAGQSLTIPMRAVEMAAGESLTMVGGSSGGYTLGGGGSLYNTMTVVFLPTN